MQMDPAAIAEPIDVSLLVRREQAQTLAQSMKVTLAASVFLALSVVAMIWDRLPHVGLIIWFVLIVAINVARMLAVANARRSRMLIETPERFLRQAWVGALIAGLAWASILAASFPYGMGFNSAIIFVCSGIMAGAVIQGRAHALTVCAFLLPIGLTHGICLARLGSLEGYVLAVDVLLYIGMLSRSAIHAQRAFIDSSRLTHAATELATSLAAANDVASVAVTRLEYLANHDPLTGVSNRTAFASAFAQSLDIARFRHEEVALMLIDLDRFKAINDTYGHGAGDQVLVEIAVRLRVKFGDDRCVARLGGDEFAVVVTGSDLGQSTAALANEMVGLACEPVLVNGRQVTVGISIGFALYPRDGYSVDELQTSADIALYAAKSAGRGTVRGFDEKLRVATDARRVFELDLADALARNDLEVWFQPQISLHERRLVGLESLIRWSHPNHGWVSPPEIVAAAAATRQSEALTTFVVDASCRMIRALTVAGLDDVSVSFNASPQELGSYSLADRVARILAAYEVAPGRLGVEITEEAMFSQERSGADLSAISAMGVRIAIDDFGVGYSSFGALKNLQFDCIKIDRVFIEGLTNGAGDRALVQAILGVARALGVKAIAEGVESAEQVAVLAGLGCMEAQGFYFAKPMPAKNILEWISTQTDAGIALIEPATPPSDTPSYPMLAKVAGG